MEGSDGLREFFDAAREAFQAGRGRLIDQTIEAHGPKAREKVAALRSARPETSDDGIAELLIRDATARASTVGAMVALPGVIAGPGTVISVALSGPEGPWLFREQVKLVLEIAEVFGFDPEDRAARTGEVEDLFGRALATVQIGNTGTQLLIMTLMRLGWGRRATLAAQFLARVALRNRLAFRRLPLLGIPIGALANAISMTAVGTEARNRYHPATNLPSPVPPTATGEEAGAAGGRAATDEEPDTHEGSSVAEDEPTVTEEEPPGPEETGV